jgi:hypothetical protein
LSEKKAKPNAAAITALVLGVIRLSERSAAFASAATHELRIAPIGAPSFSDSTIMAPVLPQVNADDCFGRFRNRHARPPNRGLA